MQYFQRVYTNPKADNYGKPFAALRFEVKSDSVVSERWDVESGKWIHDPNVLGQVTGIESDLDFEEIDESQMKKLLAALGKQEADESDEENEDEEDEEADDEDEDE